LCGDAVARLGERFADLRAARKDAVDMSAAWECNEEIVAACEAEDLAALREAIRSYEDDTLRALVRPKEESGAA
jgi:DNA-binding GntR family transcriptional regulator